MKNKSLLTFLVLICLIPLKAYACMKPIRPNAKCESVAPQDENYYRVNDLYFKFSPDYFPPDDLRYKFVPRIPLSEKYQYKWSNKIILHALYDDVSPSCKYVRKNGLSEYNLYSLYHFPTASMCEEAPPAGPYIEEFMENAVEIELLHSQSKENPYATLKKGIEGWRWRYEYLEKDADHFSVKLMNEVENFVAYSEENDDPAMPYNKSIYFNTKEGNPSYPAILVCAHQKKNTKTITKVDTLSEYESCRLSFAYKDKIRVDVRLNGAIFRFDRKNLQLTPVIDKLFKFLTQHETAPNDPGLLKYIQTGDALYEKDIGEGKYGDKFTYAARHGLVSLIQKWLDDSERPADGQPLRSVFNYKLSDEDIFKIFKMLIENGTSIEQANQNKGCDSPNSGCSTHARRPLIAIVAAEGTPAMLKLLLKYGANAKILSPGMNKTPLHWAMLNRRAAQNREMLKILLDAGADPYARDSSGKTFFSYAKDEDKGALKNWLQENGVDVTRLNYKKSIMDWLRSVK